MVYFSSKKVLVKKMDYPTYPSYIYKQDQFYKDYIRSTTIALAIQRVLYEKIDGSLAEVGVYKGDMSRFIHILAKERKYFLFDTFDGFPEQDLESGIIDNRFKDTCVNRVLSNIGETNNIFIRKGYVPDTLVGLESEKFAFVLLDLDLYDPTLSSLEFFYPRITEGGYLMVHDYNNAESNWGCKRAVDTFLKNKFENIIEIPDSYGSILVRKNKQVK
jgi:O-methyltransferase